MLNIIYLLKNKCNDKVYVGQTWCSLEERWKYGYAGCNKIYNAFKKYGRDKFYYEVLTFCSTQMIANFYEVYFIEKLNSIKNGYNIAMGGSDGTMRGRKHSQETKNKISTSHIGICHNQISKNKISLANKGKKRSDKTKLLMSQNNIGINNPNYGKTHSIETKQKISIANSAGGQLGVNNGFAKLNDIKVKEIKLLLQQRKNNILKITFKEIGILFGVSLCTINDIAKNRTWKHIQ